MTDISKQLAAAAARGVDVVVFQNAREPINLRYRWRFRETRDSGIGEFKAAGYDALVVDQDGDSSWWHIKKDGTVIAESGNMYDGGGLYHFDAALLDCEMVLSSVVRARRNAMRRRWPLSRI